MLQNHIKHVITFDLFEKRFYENFQDDETYFWETIYLLTIYES